MDIIDRAVQVLQRDGLIVYPTDTVYGLGADALSEHAVLKVFEAKGRPVGKPISVAVADVEMLSCIAVITPAAEMVIDQFLPGAVTIVLKARRVLPDILTGGTGRIGVRIPDHQIALDIIKAFDSPITATSANISGEKDPTTRDEVSVPYDLFIDGGLVSGVPSTVVDPDLRVILRRGKQADEVAGALASLG
ncbi:MAG: threonylcarbamoyl-AMP synthase [Methanomicrobiales archaeon]|nr:threonylcarbamoyl-AMP synthase [Methanomicrobiales archaeon]